MKHLPDDSPPAKHFLQQKLKNWRQRISLAVNGMHVVAVQERACGAARQGTRQPPPHNLFRAPTVERLGQDAFPREDILETADYDEE